MQRTLPKISKFLGNFVDLGEMCGEGKNKSQPDLPNVDGAQGKGAKKGSVGRPFLQNN